MFASGWSTDPIADRVSIPVYWFIVRILFKLESMLVFFLTAGKLGDKRWRRGVVTRDEGV
jgi:hypothetical protein